LNPKAFKVIAVIGIVIGGKVREMRHLGLTGGPEKAKNEGVRALECHEFSAIPQEMVRWAHHAFT
jgi:hypothetical protein